MPNQPVSLSGDPVRPTMQEWHIWQIPNEVVGRLGLRLEHGSASPGSKVIAWPI